jgi:release factor glutamine methyltransferase
VSTVRSLLASHDALASDDARRESEILLGHALGKSRAWLYAHGDEEISRDAAEMFQLLSAQRLAGTPIAYLAGHREFWTLDLVVTPAVLIPRPETELLVELALLHIPQSKKVDIVDLGTGSGAIALSIARERPLAHLVATDASEEALAVARINAERLDIRNVEFLRSDWFGSLNRNMFDVIVSNPPYIASNDNHLSQGDLRFEPRGALASGIDGLDSIREIVRTAPEHLKPGGDLLMEHGFDQGAAVRELFAQSEFVDISTSRDGEARERVTRGRKSR